MEAINMAAQTVGLFLWSGSENENLTVYKQLGFQYVFSYV